MELQRCLAERRSLDNDEVAVSPQNSSPSVHAHRAIPADFRTPLEMFYHWESVVPDKPWLRQPTDQGWREYSWRAAGMRARRLAGVLRDMGLVAGDKVAIYGANSAHWVLADLAIMMAGMISVPIYPTMPADKLRYVVDHSDTRAVFADSAVLAIDALRDLLPDGMPVIALDVASNLAADADWDRIMTSTAALQGCPVRGPQELWTIAYTSGTTGLPKGVMHSFATLPHSAAELLKVTGTGSSSRLFSYLPLAHVAERCVIEMQSFYTGASITFNRCRDSFLDDLRAVRPDFLFAVPRIWTNLKSQIVNEHGKDLWERLISAPEADKKKGPAILAGLGLDAVTFAFSGGAPISSTDIRAWHGLGMPLFESYGQSEVLSGTVNQREIGRAHV